MRSVLPRACHHFAVSGIRPVYSVSDVPGLYQVDPTRPFHLLLQTKHFFHSTLA
jgi:hypothetical protein